MHEHAVRRAADLEGLNAKLIAAKQRATTRAGDTSKPQGILGTVPRTGGAPGAHGAPPPAGAAGQPPATAPAERQLSAAEHLAKKRRERRE
jgi:hypothetical protein